MSRVYRALEKAEKEKQARVKEAPHFEVFSDEPFPEKAEIPLQVVTAPLPEVELPEGENGSIPVAPLHTLAAEQFRKLKTHIFRTSPNSLRSILVTSALPQEGKSTVSLNLAVAISQEIHKKVVLIDADLRNPSLFPEKQSSSKGLDEILTGQTSVDSVLATLGMEKFWILPAGKPSKSAAELVASRKMQDLINALRDRDEETYVLIDSPPLLSASESMMLSEWVDGVILVVLADRTPKGMVRKALESVNRKKILGVVFNQKETKGTKYASEYYYGAKTYGK